MPVGYDLVARAIVSTLVAQKLVPVRAPEVPENPPEALAE